MLQGRNYPSQKGVQIADVMSHIPYSNCPRVRLFMKCNKVKFERKLTHWGPSFLVPNEYMDAFDIFDDGNLDLCWVKDKALTYFMDKHPNAEHYV